ncbi:hypothetical protein EJ02DRAFT_502415 [Clathrospora elynae]|uniref:CFEM domain-containing protein n=1 Tax=Clathrospora elynae TaxID=706981 RepID=A0A6A5SSC9_9PLEO|nr:hypothetical protein EJ02DRAFT_502415 [Clathrospora elynae]
MRVFNAILAALAMLPAAARAQESTAAIAMLQKALPPCALNCMVELIPRSTCDLTNTTCICTNAPLNEQLGICVLGGCTVPESLVMKNVSLTMCGAEVRDNTDLPYYIAIVGSAVTTFFVFLRLFLVFMPGGKRPGWEDGLIVLCLALCLVPGGLSGPFKENGLGRDLWYLKPEQITNILRFYFIGEIAYLQGMGILKIAILLFLLAIFPDKTFRKSVYVTIGLCVAYCITFLVATIFQCTPVSYSWTQWDSLHEGTCNNIHLQAWMSAIINIVLDVIVMVLPLRQILNLKMNWKKKASVLSMFLVGTVVLVVSIVRLQSLIQFSNSTNISWDYVPSSYWSILELDIGIICACMPSVRGLILRYFPKALSTRMTKGSHGYSNGLGSDNKFSRNRAPSGLSKSDFIPLVNVHTTEGGIRRELDA